MRSHYGGGGGNGEYALTKPQTTRMRGGGGGEEHIEATNELADAFLRWCASTSSSESRRLLLRSYGRAEEAEEMKSELTSWLAGARGVAQVMAGRARASAACGSVSRRPATHGIHVSEVF